MNILIAIPARLESTRLPRKLLLCATGKPLLQHTIEAAIRCGHDVALVTDSHLLARPSYYDTEYGTDIVCHVSDAPASSGTERIEHDLDALQFDLNKPLDLIINWQADEPELKPEHIDHLIEIATQFPGCDMATLASIATEDDHRNPDVVKVRRGLYGYAEEFSRRPLPNGYRHIGIYAYTPRFLRWFASQPPSEREQGQSLEQLRALDAGCHIHVGIVDHPYRGIDTRADDDAFVEREKARQHAALRASRLPPSFA